MSRCRKVAGGNHPWEWVEGEGQRFKRLNAGRRKGEIIVLTKRVCTKCGAQEWVERK